MVELDSIENHKGKISLLFSVDTKDWQWLAKEIQNAGLEIKVFKEENRADVEINGTELMFWIR